MSEETKAPVQEPKGELVKVAVPLDERGMVAPKDLDQQLRVARWMLESGLLPKGIATVSQAWMVMQRGAELGFRGLAACEYCYPVNGRVRLTPAGARAKALESGLLEDVKEETAGEGDTLSCRVTVKRKGLPTPVVGEFSMPEAKVAGLAGKDNWKNYPKRMLLARARGYAFGDAFTDICGGLQVRETFDLDPDEAIGGEPLKPATVATPPATPDPLLSGGPRKPAEPAATATKPVGCKHSGVPPSKVDALPRGRSIVCQDCGQELSNDLVEDREPGDDQDDEPSLFQQRRAPTPARESVRRRPGLE